MNLNTKLWKPFILNNLYSIQMGNKFDRDKMSEENPTVNFVSRISYNNGVDGIVDRIDRVDPFNSGSLTVALGGSYLGSCFIQYAPFYTAQNVAVLLPKYSEMTYEINLFISYLIRFEAKSKYYAFGRELNTHIDTDFYINLPILLNDDGTPIIDETKQYSEKGYIPDWAFMEKYIKSLKHKPVTTKNRKENVVKLGIAQWKSFKIGDIFSIINGSGITSEEIEEHPGTLNAVQSGEKDNGVLGKIDFDYCVMKRYSISELPCLTVARSGSAGFVSFQPFGCVVGDSAKILLLPKNVATTGTYLFLQTLLMANKFKYAYGRKVTEDKYADDYINLPILLNDDGTPIIDETKQYSEKGYIPDWAFMEKYIKSLPYGDRVSV